jgi:hypothetical protein
MSLLEVDWSKSKLKYALSLIAPPPGTPSQRAGKLSNRNHIEILGNAVVILSLLSLPLCPHVRGRLQGFHLVIKILGRYCARFSSMKMPDSVSIHNPEYPKRKLLIYRCCMQSSSSSDLARIRENQRRSRARRKEYIQYLENRLLGFERLGVEASTEMQNAARKVAIENECLRSLLKLRGMTEIDIDEHLHSDRDVSLERDLHKWTEHVKPLPRLGVARNRQHWNPFFGSPSPPISHPVDQVPSSPRSPSLLPDVLDDSPCSQGPENSEPVTPSPDYPPTGDPRLRNDEAIPQKTDTETDCVLAATIITGMRGGSDIEEVRAELGCSQGTDCQVENVAIFQIMDR